MKKKIYFVTETDVGGVLVRGEKFNRIVKPGTEETIFDDVFQITECADFEKYEQKGDFLDAVIGIEEEYFDKTGDKIASIELVAVDEDTDILQWGVSIKLLEDEKFQYTTLDYKSSGHILKYEDSDTDPIVDQEELCQYIKDWLGEDSKLTLEDIDAVLNLEMDYLRSNGIVAD